MPGMFAHSRLDISCTAPVLHSACSCPACPHVQQAKPGSAAQARQWLPQEAVGTIAEERSECAALRGRLASLEAHAAESAEERGAEVTRLLDQVQMEQPQLVQLSQAA